MSQEFTHLDDMGRARMVDVGGKESTDREAVASARVRLGEKAYHALMEGGLPKGDALAVSRIAGIMAAKKVGDLIPLCHPLPLHVVEISFAPYPRTFSVVISAKARTTGQTGVEMEAMTAASVAALALYDMCKSLDKGIIIEAVCLDYKSGGKSGVWKRYTSGE